MSFRNTIDPTIGKLRRNAGKNYQQSVVITTTDNLASPVRMFRKNAGKIYTPEPTTSQQIIEVTKPQLMRVGGKQRGIGGSAIATPSDKFKNVVLFFNGTGCFYSKGTGFPFPLVVNYPAKNTSVHKYNGSSLYFNGSSYFQLLPETFGFGTSDYTIEFWIRIDFSGYDYSHIFYTSPVNCGYGLRCFVNGGTTSFGGTGVFVLYSEGSNYPFLTSTTIIRQTGWHHIAISRSGLITKLFINGNIESVHTATGIANIQALYPRIMSPVEGPNPYNFNHETCYIDDFICSLEAKYTSNFTPPLSFV